MKTLLHYLKFDWLRWRLPVLLLWLLLAIFGFSFWMLPDSRHQDGASAFVPWIMAYGALLTILIGISDSPVRRRTWLLTRAGSRRVWFTARLGFVLLTVAIPLAAAYAFMPFLTGFNWLTVIHAFWLALKVTALLTAALWLWARSWPHLPALILGLGLIGSLGIIGYAAGWRLPPEWTALRPDNNILLVCLTLPALLCLQAAGRNRRRFAILGWLAGFLLPILWLTAAVISRGVRAAFPGPLERALLSSEKNRTFTVISVTPRIEYHLSGNMPFLLRGYGETTADYPAVGSIEILTACHQRPGDAGWSPWRPATGQISQHFLHPGPPPGVPQNSPALVLDSFTFDASDVTTPGDFTFRLRGLASLVGQVKRIEIPAGSGHWSGHGWAYDIPAREYFSHEVRLAPGMGIGTIAAVRDGINKEWWSAPNRPWRPGSHYYSAGAWSSIVPLQRVTPEEYRRLASAPATLEFYQYETCLCELTLEKVGIRVFQPLNSLKKPQPPAPVAPEKSTREPFDHYLSNYVWPLGTNIPEPAADSGIETAAHYLHWLKGREYKPGDDTHAALAARWWRESLTMAVRQPLQERNALLKAMSAGFPAEHRTELLKHLAKSPWLVSVVLERGWQEDAKPYVLAAMRDGARIMPPEWLSLVRSYRDPAFNSWMKREFILDVPSVLYWESIPELAEALQDATDSALHGWPYLSGPQHEAILTSGNPNYLAELLRALAGKHFVNQHRAAVRLHDSVRDANGSPPPSHGLPLRADGEWKHDNSVQISPQFLQWFSGLTVSDFTFDRTQRRFVRKPSTPRTP